MLKIGRGMTAAGVSLAAALLLAGCTASSGIDWLADRVEWPEVQFAVDDRAGYRVIEVANGDGVTYLGSFNLTVGYGPHPWMIAFIYPNGTANVTSHWAYSNAHLLQGAGVAYATRHGEGVEAPTLIDDALPLAAAWAWDAKATRGHLVVAWTGFTAPGVFNFTFTPGTHVREVASGSTDWFDLRGFERGTSVGLAPAVGVGRGLATDLAPAPGYQKLGLVSTYSNQATFGGARVTLEDDVIDLPFRGVCTINCDPVRFRAALFTTDAPATVHVDWEGNHRNTRAVVTHLDVPLGLLPEVVHVFDPPT